MHFIMRQNFNLMAFTILQFFPVIAFSLIPMTCGASDQLDELAKFAQQSLNDNIKASITVGDSWLTVSVYKNSAECLRVLSETNRQVAINIGEVHIVETNASEKAAGYLKNFPTLKVLIFQRNRFEFSKWAPHLANCRALEEIWCHNCNVDDKSMEYISKCGSLKVLMASQNPLTDAGVKYLSRCNKLRQLSLAETHLSNGALVHLTSLSNLEILWLNDTKLTDDAIPEIVKCKSLKTVILTGTKITESGAIRLYRQLGEVSRTADE